MRAIAIAAVIFLVAALAGYGSPGASGSATHSGAGLDLVGRVASISCGGPGDCAAAGNYRDGNHHWQVFVVNETNGSWGTAIPVPGLATLNTGGNAGVSSISCAAAGECAAGGWYADGDGSHFQAFVASETNGKWGKAIEVPRIATLNAGRNAVVDSISCGAAGDCAAGGRYLPKHGSREAFVVDETNGHWGDAITVPGAKTFTSSGDAQLIQVSCPAAGECGAGGYYRQGFARAFVVNETNGTWGNAIEVTFAPASSAGVSAISCSAPGECAATGDFYNPANGGARPFAVAETNGSWGAPLEVPAPTPYGPTWGDSWFNSVSCAAAGECAAAGQTSGGQDIAFVVSETNGSWSDAIEAPGTAGYAAANSISCGAPGECAAGGSDNGTPFVVSETNGSWDDAIDLPVTGYAGGVDSVSCAAAGECSAGGSSNDSSGQQRPFVVSETNGSWDDAIRLRFQFPCVVPNVAGSTLRAAKAKLRHAHCGVGKITSVYSVRSPGLVTDPHPPVGKILTPGTVIALGVSRGRRPASPPKTHAKTHWRAIVIEGEKKGVLLGSISCASPGNCSAVGSYVDNLGDTEGLLLSEKAGQWGIGLKAALPANAGSNPQVSLNAVSCVSVGNCVAVGGYTDDSGNQRGLLLTETAGHWARGVEAVPAGQALTLNDVSCGSPGNCAAIGHAGDGALLLREQAGRWRRGVDLQFGETTQLSSVSCAPGGGCGAVGYYSYTVGGGRDGSSEVGVPLLLVTKRGGWREIEPVMPRNGPGEGVSLTSISCPSAGNCSATGLYNAGIDDDGGIRGVLLTEKAGKWQRGVMALPPKNAGNGYVGLWGISCSSPGDCVAIGRYYSHHGHERLTLLTEKAGKWRRGVNPSLPRHGRSFEGATVSCASPGNCTVVGSYGRRRGRGGFLLTESAGAWAGAVRAPLPVDSVSVVSCASPGNCGAVGSDSRGDGILLDSTTDPCVVPDVSGKSLREAEHSIKSGNCWVGRIKYARSTTTETGRVIAQTLRPGRHFVPGTKVNLTIGSGP